MWSTDQSVSAPNSSATSQARAIAYRELPGPTWGAKKPILMGSAPICGELAASPGAFRQREAWATASAAARPATARASVLRVVRLSRKAPSMAQKSSTASSRARPGPTPAATNRSTSTASHDSKASAAACASARSCSPPRGRRWRSGRRRRSPSPPRRLGGAVEEGPVAATTSAPGGTSPPPAPGRSRRPPAGRPRPAPPCRPGRSGRASRTGPGWRRGWPSRRCRRSRGAGTAPRWRSRIALRGAAGQVRPSAEPTQ